MPKSGLQVKEDFVRRGQTIKQWAEHHNFHLSTVSAVINGHVKGNYGLSHKVAVALGIKGPIHDDGDGADAP